MIRYTTPTIILEVEKDLTDMEVYVSLKYASGNVQHIKIDPDLMHVCDDETKIYLTFTQEMTGELTSGTTVRVQINWINAAGIREATDIKTFSVTENLYDEVITYE